MNISAPHVYYPFVFTFADELSLDGLLSTGSQFEGISLELGNAECPKKQSKTSTSPLSLDIKSWPLSGSESLKIEVCFHRGPAEEIILGK